MAKDKNTIELPVVNEGDLSTLLIDIREKAGYSLTQMAEALCLSEEVVKNLESEDFERLAEPPYVRGYLRNYAKLGETDSDELITIYEALRGADASELNYRIKASETIHTSTSHKLTPVMAQLLFLALLIAAIAGISMIPGVNTWMKDTWTSIAAQFSTETGAPTENNPDLIGSLPVPLPLPDDVTPVQTTESDTSSAQTNQANTAETPQVNTPTNEDQQAPQTEDAATVTTSTNTPEPANTEQTTTTNTTTNPPAAESESSNQVSLKLIFNKDVWMRIRDKDNKTLFEGINKSGTNKSLQFEKPLTFRVGNAQGLSLFVDDKAVDITSYINGSIANFTLE